VRPPTPAPVLTDEEIDQVLREMEERADSSSMGTDPLWEQLGNGGRKKRKLPMAE
jgi:hypothetical protein